MRSRSLAYVPPQMYILKCTLKNGVAQETEPQTFEEMTMLKRKMLRSGAFTHVKVRKVIEPENGRGWQIYGK